MSSYRDLPVWKPSFDLVIRIYKLTSSYPTVERYTLTSQMRRAAISIPSNLAEGYRRRTPASQLQFVLIAFGSASELEVQLQIAQALGYGDHETTSILLKELENIQRQLNGFCSYLKRVK